MLASPNGFRATWSNRWAWNWKRIRLKLRFGLSRENHNPPCCDIELAVVALNDPLAAALWCQDETTLTHTTNLTFCLQVSRWRDRAIILQLLVQFKEQMKLPLPFWISLLFLTSRTVPREMGLYLHLPPLLLVMSAQSADGYHIIQNANSTLHLGKIILMDAIFAYC